ncbi:MULTISPECIES: tRNA epoxyqueuosine(34) reductase QueG [Planococcus]|uniref:Epoxyqueuosine reductase n=2 Tax=Planococcus TaxID=1372 RepID=A0ABN4JWW5_9BACL|nr:MULTISPECIES: tRNA epoxyqueuosine(34) reductase QueG [Planococcus]ALS79330.1 epoxyqueuosine reductase [Planococcus kocurii]AQU78701.1 tRNA epoxyqueuosine(34) reductase QueG [Planococcus faecalis]KAA0956800.1 tRNA epoxyqueuosine(34) reductase QueG [Planococcus sp. ANT_H30]MDJ0332391.1 tRNA epoxyqueuosine(34) reductase QueG [Planococcus sp. S3-L1]OHX53315.1 tRNA epoxyqueuosine(34) reductase QueG [Planococcus faecalis]
MNLDQFQKELVAYASDIGIDKIGFASAEPFYSLKHQLIRQQQLNYQSGFEESDVEKRTRPELLLNEAVSIVAIAIAYPSKMEDAPQGVKGARRGMFSRSSWGKDYHAALRERLTLLEAFIASRYPEARMRSMVDTGELSDRAVAERAGIGWSAKNTNIITPEFGSYVYLGEMITNIPFRFDEPMEDQCGDCRLCIDTCPTGAIVEGGQLNAQRCISFLTQTKGFLPDEFRSKIGNRLYGCDTCQTVCPKNKRKANQIHAEFEPDPEIAKPLLLPLLTISNREFKDKFGYVSGSWRGKKPIQRNAILALAHFKETAAIPVLIQLLDSDERPVIRGTAAWAIGKIGTDEGLEALKRVQQLEKDGEVQEEIQKGLAFFAERLKG